MSYSKHMKQFEKESKRKRKIEKLESLQDMENETKRKENMFFLLLNEEKENNIRLEKEHNERVIKINNLLNEYATILSYKEWLTLRDILTYDFYQVESDLLKGKINNEIVGRMKDIANKEMSVTI